VFRSQQQHQHHRDAASDKSAAILGAGKDAGAHGSNSSNSSISSSGGDSGGNPAKEILSLISLPGTRHLGLNIFAVNINRLLGSIRARYAVAKHACVSEDRLFNTIMSLFFDWGFRGSLDAELSSNLGLRRPPGDRCYGVFSDGGHAMTILLPG
jgi:hypothetical protein